MPGGHGLPRRGLRGGPLNAALYVGTAACWTAIERALADRGDDVVVLVVLGPELVPTVPLSDDLDMVRAIVVERLRPRLAALVARRDAPAAQVFGTAVRATEPAIEVVERASDAAMGNALRRAAVTELWAARSALEVLGAAGLALADTAQREGVRLRTV